MYMPPWRWLAVVDGELEHLMDKVTAVVLRPIFIAVELEHAPDDASLAFPFLICEVHLPEGFLAFGKTPGPLRMAVVVLG